MSTTTTGKGWKGYCGMAEESSSATYATAAPSTVYPALMSESFEADESFEYPEPIQAAPWIFTSSPGRRAVKGNLVPLADPISLGLPLKWANRAVTDTTFPPAPTTLTATPAAGGTYGPGAVKYAVAQIFNLTGAIRPYRWVGNLTPVASATMDVTNKKANLAWVNAAPLASPPMDVYGTMIFASAPGSSDLFYLATVVGAGLTYLDDGSVTLSSIPAPTAVVTTQHAYTGSSDDLKTFSLEFGLDLDKNKQIIGTKVGSLDIKASEKGVLGFTFACQAQDMLFITPTTPTFVDAPFFTGQNSIVYLQPQTASDVLFAQNKDLTFKLDNKLEMIDNSGYVSRRINDGPRDINASFTFQMENTVQVQRILQNRFTYQRMAYHYVAWGQPLDGGALVVPSSDGYFITFWPGLFEIVLPCADFDAIKAPLANKQQIIQSIAFKRALYDATLQADCALRLTNTTASYPDVA